MQIGLAEVERTTGDSRTWVWIFIAVMVWSGLHFFNWNSFIFHDTWKHNFPVQYAIALQAGCGAIPIWLGSVDHGSPTLLYLISFSLTQILRIPEMLLLGCTMPSIELGIMLHKAWLFGSYLVFALGMWVAGKALFSSRVAAAYLVIATLFSGLCLDMHHSDQVLSQLFWCPWIVAAIAYADACPVGDSKRVWLWVAAATFLLVSLLDQYPHLYVVPAAIGITAYWIGSGRSDIRLYGRTSLFGLSVLIILAIATAYQLLAVKHAIVNYAPSLRSSLIVDPSTFGHTGFVQPTALLDLLFPLGILIEFDALSGATSKFIFRLDNLVFMFGAIPLLFFLGFFVNPAVSTRKRLSWGIFLLAILAVSLQQTRLYFLLFQFPFFNVFRSYFLYSVYFMLGTLFVSALGFDALLRQSFEVRAKIFKRAGMVLLMCVIVTGAVLLSHALRVEQVDAVRRIAWFSVIDMVILSVAVTAFWRTTTSGSGAAAIVALIVLQTATLGAAYQILGVDRSAILDWYGPQEQARAAGGVNKIVNGGAAIRVPCDRFAECYTKRTMVASDRADLNGTFLRHIDEPIFAEKMKPEVRRQLAGITHPVFWFSAAQIRNFSSRNDLIEGMNANSEHLSKYLREATSLVGYPKNENEITPVVGAVTSARILADGYWVEYSTQDRGILNASIARSYKWRVSVNGTDATLWDSNVSGVAVEVPPGAGVVQFSYVDRTMLGTVTLRLLCLLAAIIALGYLCISVFRLRLK